MSNVKVDEIFAESGLPHGKNQKGSPKILIADHNPPIAELVSGILQQDGYQIRVEQSSSGAIQSVGEFRPQLLVIDPVMPGIMGDDTAMRISDETKCKVLFLTVAASDPWLVEMLRDLRERGCDCEALTKPFEAEELLDHVHRRIGAANLIAELHAFTMKSLREMWDGRLPTWEEFKQVNEVGQVRADKSLALRAIWLRGIPKFWVVIYGILVPWTASLAVPTAIGMYFLFGISVWWILGSVCTAWFLFSVTKEGACEAIKDGAARDKELYEMLVKRGAFLFGPTLLRGDAKPEPHDSSPVPIQLKMRVAGWTGWITGVIVGVFYVLYKRWFGARRTKFKA